MFQTLSAKLGDVFRSFTGQSTVTQPVIDAGVKTIRRALLEADVAAPVITQLTENFSKKALGQVITAGAKPGDMLTKLFHDELVDILGKGQNFSLNLASPSTIMLVGLQGAGKTTFAARLAKHLQKEGFDVYNMDFRGHGYASHDAANQRQRGGWSVDSYGIYDIHAAIQFIKEKHPAQKPTYIAHSLGGLAFVSYLSKYNSMALSKVVIVASPFDFRHP